MNDQHWVIVNSSKDLILVSTFFKDYNHAHNYAQLHLSGTQDWRVIPIKLYEIL